MVSSDCQVNLNPSFTDLILSPMARGYFQKAISMSGSALNHLFYQPDPAGIARELAANLGLSPGLTSAQLIAALREMTPDQLIAATSPIVETVREEFHLPNREILN